jgi:hypothetical protein
VIESNYITADEWETLATKWDAGWSGQSWFRKSVDGTEYQVYIHDVDKLVSFVQAWGKRVPFHLTRYEYERLFNE